MVNKQLSQSCLVTKRNRTKHSSSEVKHPLSSLHSMYLRDTNSFTRYKYKFFSNKCCRSDSFSPLLRVAEARVTFNILMPMQHAVAIASSAENKVQKMCVFQGKGISSLKLAGSAL